jgi:hypothetical protein
MLPTTRLGQVMFALGTLVVMLAVLLPPVTFRLTDLGVAHGGANISLVGDGSQHLSSSGMLFHVGGCKFVGQSSICTHKELSYDHAHGLRLAAIVSSRPPNGI